MLVKQLDVKKFIRLLLLLDTLRIISLSKLGDINLWIDSKAYNFVENTHQLWLLSICDLIIGKREYHQHNTKQFQL